jgi:hypothetical protein
MDQETPKNFRKISPFHSRKQSLALPLRENALGMMLATLESGRWRQSGHSDPAKLREPMEKG